MNRTEEELARQAAWQADRQRMYDEFLAVQTAQLKVRIAADPDGMATALAQFLTGWDHHVAEIGVHMNCGEVEVLADLYTALGMPEVAQHWLEYHCEDDDEGDQHWELRERLLAEEQAIYAAAGLKK